MGIRENYQNKAASQLHKWEIRINEIRLDYENDSSGSTGRNQSLQALEKLHRLANDRLDELISARESRWEFSKQAVERAMIDLKCSLDEADEGKNSHLLKLKDHSDHGSDTFFRKG
jgi:hypothetical protein